MEGSGLQEEGSLHSPWPRGSPSVHGSSRLWAAAEPQQCLVPQGHGGATHGVPGSYLSHSRAVPPPCRRHGYGWEFCRQRT